MTLTKIHHEGERMETGPLQVGDDWPGVFIRGDDALTYAFVLQHAIQFMPVEHWPDQSVLNGLLQTLRSCHIDNHRSAT